MLTRGIDQNDNLYSLYLKSFFFFGKLLTIENNYFEMNVHWNKSAVLLLLI